MEKAGALQLDWMCLRGGNYQKTNLPRSGLLEQFAAADPEESAI